MPPGVGLGVDAVRPAGPQRPGVPQRVVPERRDQPGGLGGQDVGGLGELDRERGVEQVGGGHAVVHPGRGRPRLGVVRPGGQEGDHVVIGDRLDRGYRLGGGRLGRTDGFHAHRRHRARPGLRLQDEHLHPAPQLVLVRLAPDPPHLGQRVPLDHASKVSARGGRPPGTRPDRGDPSPGPQARPTGRGDSHGMPGRADPDVGDRLAKDDDDERAM